jgi:lipopolysaccharide export LptBFGC system permease protein LptF
MKKILISLALILLILPSVLAINIDVEKESSNEVLIMDLDKPLVIDLKITNNGPSDNFEFYNLVGFSISPVGTTPINTGETKEMQLEFTPLGNIKDRGFYTLSYYIRGQDKSEVEEQITFKILDLKDIFEVGSGDIDLESNSIEIFIKNREDLGFENVDVKFSSAFFELEENFSMAGNEKKEFTIWLNREDFRELKAGFYTLKAKVTVEGEEANVEGIIKFVEKDLVTTTKKDYGFLINTKIIEKKNEGNTVLESETVIKKNIISRLFTSFSPQPDIVEREGGTVYYTWLRDVGPGETLEIRVRTNWLLPLVVIFFIVAIVVLAKQYTRTNLVLRKKVTFVRAKGGEFALKVSIIVNAKRYVERVNVIDRLPPLVNIYERFGGEKPDRIDEKNRRLEWNFEKLEAGEMRMLSYIIYSKVGILGKFALPTATAIYERDGEIQEAESNRAFFMAEQRKTRTGEE